MTVHFFLFSLFFFSLFSFCIYNDGNHLLRPWYILFLFVSNYRNLAVAYDTNLMIHAQMMAPFSLTDSHMLFQCSLATPLLKRQVMICEPMIKRGGAGEDVGIIAVYDTFNEL